MKRRVWIHLLAAIISIAAIFLMYGFSIFLGKDEGLRMYGTLIFPVWFVTGYIGAFLNLRKVFGKRDVP